MVPEHAPKVVTIADRRREHALITGQRPAETVSEFISPKSDRSCLLHTTASIAHDPGHTLTEMYNIAKQAIAAGDNAMSVAAEYLATIHDLGISIRVIASKVGKQKSWVHRLLQWRRSGFSDGTPFGPASKARRKRVQATGQSAVNKKTAEITVSHHHVAQDDALAIPAFLMRDRSALRSRLLEWSDSKLIASVATMATPSGCACGYCLNSDDQSLSDHVVFAVRTAGVQ